MADVYCKTCKFFQGSALGVCLRYPEQIGKAEHQWCGEYVAKKQQQMLALPVVELPESLTVTVTTEQSSVVEAPKRRGRPKKGENDVQTSA